MMTLEHKHKQCSALRSKLRIHKAASSIQVGNFLYSFEVHHVALSYTELRHFTNLKEIIHIFFVTIF